MADIEIIILLACLILLAVAILVLMIFNQRNIDTKLAETQNFLNYIKFDPAAKGGVGEGIVEMILSYLPEGSYKIKYKIPGTNCIPDFLINLPNSDLAIPLDSKFILPKEIENLEEIINDAKAINKLNKMVLERAEEISRYTLPQETTDFVLMYIPDFVYHILTSETYRYLADMYVIPTNTSSLLSTVFMINMQHRFIKLNQGAYKLGNFQTSTSQQIRSIIKCMETSWKHIGNLYDRLEEAKDLMENLADNVDNFKFD